MDGTRDDQVTGPGLPPVTPFERLRRTHSLMVAGETAMAVALADSLFLSISPDAARGKVILFLAVSMAPFVVIGPWMGKRIDRMRGGHRMLVVGVGVLRAVVMLLISRSLDSLTLFPLAFGALVLGKTYAIAKSAIVPTTVRSDRALVESNSRLGQTAGITGFVVAPVAAALQVVGASFTLVLGALAFLFAAVNAWRLPRVAVADAPPASLEIEEMHSPVIMPSVRAMRTLRLAVGFMFFHMAFWLRGQSAGTAWFGLAVSLSGLATLTANFVAPRLNKRMRESTMMMSSLVLVAVAGVLATWYDRVVGGILLAAAVNAAAAFGRLSFESTVQSGAPDANRGRMFATFETHNQLAWVLGGLVPVVIDPAGWLGFAVVAMIGVTGTTMFVRDGGVATRFRFGRSTDQARRPR